ncbi:MAG: rRNA maturation RNase YbeY [Leptolyngbyaceae bacterium]|nr:rRNA maturation RNase YbeY [Leptolyngbyaceae bacterium]
MQHTESHHTESQHSESHPTESTGVPEASFNSTLHASLVVEVCVQYDDVLLDEQTRQQPSDSLATSQSVLQTQIMPMMVPLLAEIRTIPWNKWVTLWLAQLAPNYSPIDAYELALRLTDDSGIQVLNAEYRDRDRPTDVLAFATIDSPYELPVELYEAQPYYLGDIVISLETAYLQAQEAGHSLTTELAWLSSHGLLHLLGWDHPDEKSLESMLDKQHALLSLIDLTGISA